MDKLQEFLSWNIPADGVSREQFAKILLTHAACLLQSANPNLQIKDAVLDVLVTYKKVHEIFEEAQKKSREGQ